jgi:hypothetical protein
MLEIAFIGQRSMRASRYNWLLQSWGVLRPFDVAQRGRETRLYIHLLVDGHQVHLRSTATDLLAQCLSIHEY